MSGTARAKDFDPVRDGGYCRGCQAGRKFVHDETGLAICAVCGLAWGCVAPTKPPTDAARARATQHEVEARAKAWNRYQTATPPQFHDPFTAGWGLAREYFAEQTAALRDRVEIWQEVVDQDRREVAALREENARLRGAAKAFLKQFFHVDNGLCSVCRGYWPREHRPDCLGARFRALLAGTEPEGQRAGQP